MKMTLGRPNLFVIGAMKAGTTSLHAAFSTHPRIFMCRSKEPNYFIEEGNWSKGEQWYLRLFADAGDKPIVGEASTGYTKAPRIKGVPERIMRFQPHAKCIYILRDPIERTISHYWFNAWRQGERRDLLTAIRQDPHYCHVSHYAAQLAPYMKLLGKDRVYTLTLEELIANPSTALRGLFAWLGVDSSRASSMTLQRENAAPQQIRQVRRGMDFLLRLKNSPWWSATGHRMPQGLRAIGLRLLARKMDRKLQPVDRVIELLRPVQLEQTQALSEMLGRQFPEWTTLFGRSALSPSCLLEP